MELPIPLLFAPLIGAVAAGNCVILKPSPASPHTTAVSKKIIKEAFDPRHVIDRGRQ
ncbi:MAG: aldehyde dehydrogenase family protein [Coprobacter sp.]